LSFFHVPGSCGLQLTNMDAISNKLKSLVNVGQVFM